MTYLSFLLVFVILPVLLLLSGIEWRQASEWGDRPRWVFAPYIPAQAAIALIYTTPWDNYLVARGVWSYDPKRTLGWSIGWVPIEEYLFFIFQPVLVGLWMEWIRDRSGMDLLRSSDPRWRWAGLAGCVALGLGSAVLWREIGPPWTYTALITLWGLPPLMLQIAFGGDLLRSKSFAWLRAWLPPGLYLSAADALAIQWGIWSIAPDQSTGWKIAG
ncbi:MAG: lycopene cyclase domain-containing protein, partial [Thermoflexus sp.]